MLRAVHSMLFGLSLLIFSFPVFADDGTWKAGLAREVITPSEMIWMAGYASRDKPAEGVLHDLWIKALALEDASGNRAVILTSDLIGISRSVYDRVAVQLNEKLGLKREQFMLTSSHTHCGPVIKDSLESLYPLTDEQFAKIKAYTSELEEKIVRVIVAAFAELEPAALKAGEGIARFAVNRRENPEAEVPKLREEGKLKGPIDHAVPVLMVQSPEGELRAVVFGYACHNTTLSFFQFCGDYAGFAQIELEKAHPGVQAMFYTGCGGDQNPLPRRSVELCEQYGTMLADAVEDTLKQESAPLKPTLEMAFRMVDLKLGSMPSDEWLRQTAEGNNYVARWAKRMLQNQEEGKELPRSYPYPIQVWRLGGRQWWISLGGEVVVDYALRLKKELGPSIWVAGYANDVMAYIPSARVLAEGGYEGNTSMYGYGLPAERWAPDVEERITESVHELVKEIQARK